MKILSCETSTLLGSVSISDDQHILSSRSIQRAGSYSDTLNGMIQDCLKEAKLKLSDIDLFVSGLGPGSFTGIRISLNTIKALAYIQNKPCVGLDSLSLMAEQAKKDSDHITVMINAFKNMVYIAEYKFTGNNESKKISIIKPPQVVRVQDLKSFLNLESLVLGDGYLAYENYFHKNLGINLKRKQNILDFPLASTACEVLGNNLESQIDLKSKKYHWSNLIPIYLRSSEAEENLNGIKFVPL